MKQGESHHNYGLNASVDVSSNNDTSMTTVAEFFAVPELQGTRFSCVGQISATIKIIFGFSRLAHTLLKIRCCGNTERGIIYKHRCEHP